MKLGRLPRKFNPRVPHMSALRMMGMPLPAAPPSCDYTAALPADLGMMNNDRLGCCTCAAAYHALQVWTANANPPIDTEADANVLQMYEEACGYNPADPKSDEGGCEQDVLQYFALRGLPLGAGGAARQRLAAFVEVDVRNLEDVKRAIASCGVLYIGFDVPDYLMGATSWELHPSGSYQIVGGHAVVLAGYDAAGFKAISWGRVYSGSWEFFSAFTDEAYALADTDWIETTGQSPAGLTLAQLEDQMSALRSAS